MSDIGIVFEDDEKLFVRQCLTGNAFRHEQQPDWLSLRSHLEQQFLKYWTSNQDIHQQFWGIIHVLHGDIDERLSARNPTDLHFDVWGLKPNAGLPFFEQNTKGWVHLYTCDGLGWWREFAETVDNLDEKAPVPALGDWGWYLADAYNAMVLSAFKTIGRSEGCKRCTDVDLGVWPGTKEDITSKIAPDSGLLFFVNFPGETAEEVINFSFNYADVESQL